MNTFIADPEWGWWIVFYFYFGGIAAGMYVAATLIDLVGTAEDREIPRIGYGLAFPLLMICGVLLIVDLNRPERFWHMLFKSEVVKDALAEGWPLSAIGWQRMAGAPTLKTWSPMSVGSWALTLFGLCTSLSFLGSLWPEGRLAGLLRFSVGARLLQGMGCLVGFFIAAYTGSLLTATNQPIWSDSPWIAALFLSSAASTGLALMIVLARRQRVATPALARLEKADLYALGLELIVFSAFLASLGSLLVPVLLTPHGKLLILGTLLVGVLAPLAIHLGVGTARPRSALLAAMLTLLGGFLLRYSILQLPPELVRTNSTILAGFSPEQGRVRGAGTGADPGNHPTQFQPRSKIPLEESAP